MNIYEDEQVERKLNELTDQLGTLVLDMLLVSLKKINHESEIFQEFEDAGKITEEMPVPF
jgi:ATP-dependent RNA circularization protein (DNA/RNA ligase family)